MTRRDFEALAGAIATTKRHTRTTLGSAHVLRLVAEDIARVCAGSNPRFDRERFLIAAGARSPFEVAIRDALTHNLDNESEARA